MSEFDAPEVATAPESTSKRSRRLEKTVDYENGTVKFTVVSTGQDLVCDTKLLPAEIKAKLIPLAISHRIGDAAAGADGVEALTQMQKVWEGLCAGNFTIRTPAKKGLDVAAIKTLIQTLSGKEATAAAALFEKLGIKLA